MRYDYYNIDKDVLVMLMETKEVINYKKLCQYLHKEYMGGKSKTSFLKHIDGLCKRKFVSATKFIIVEVYEESQWVDGRIKTNYTPLGEFNDKAGIYKIEFENDIYIGQTNNFGRRYAQHRITETLYDKPSKTYQMIKAGATFDILEVIDNREQRLIKEREWTEYYKRLGYNVVNIENVLYKKDIDKPRMATIRVPAENKDAIIALLTEHGLL